jgi:hypothetical protein
MKRHQETPRSVEAEEPHRKGWDIVAVFLALHAVLGLKVSTLGPRRTAATGDPLALWGGFLFALWGAACLVAHRAEERSILFRILNGTRAASFVGWIFMILAAYLVARYLGIV